MEGLLVPLHFLRRVPTQKVSELHGLKRQKPRVQPDQVPEPPPQCRHLPRHPPPQPQVGERVQVGPKGEPRHRPSPPHPLRTRLKRRRRRRRHCLGRLHAKRNPGEGCCVVGRVVGWGRQHGSGDGVSPREVAIFEPLTQRKAAREGLCLFEQRLEQLCQASVAAAPRAKGGRRSGGSSSVDAVELRQHHKELRHVRAFGP
mmetsp:Transcript_33979/g.67577  ORF Transcript_33979/g.67577 Transcript_33979/m.67577 type:complete len:201 (+) Transcript_33979:284-886(+)